MNTEQAPVGFYNEGDSLNCPNCGGEIRHILSSDESRDGVSLFATPDIWYCADLCGYEYVE